LTSNRFYVDEADVQLPLAVLKGKEHHHLARVARTHPGDMVWLVDVAGMSYRARVEKIKSDQTELVILEKKPAVSQKINIILAQAVLKLNGMELVLQKSTELGAAVIVPILAARTVVKIKENLGGKLERWSRIMRAAAKQCGRPLPPELWEPIPLSSWLEHPREARKLLLHEDGDTFLKDVIQSASAGTQSRVSVSDSVIILVGPEGGWTKSEQISILERGYEAVVLSNNTLRAETAAITSLAIISHFWNT